MSKQVTAGRIGACWSGQFDLPIVEAGSQVKFRCKDMGGAGRDVKGTVIANEAWEGLILLHVSPVDGFEFPNGQPEECINADEGWQ